MHLTPKWKVRAVSELETQKTRSWFEAIILYDIIHYLEFQILSEVRTAELHLCHDFPTLCRSIHVWGA